MQALARLYILACWRVNRRFDEGVQNAGLLSALQSMLRNPDRRYTSFVNTVDGLHLTATRR